MKTNEIYQLLTAMRVIEYFELQQSGQQHGTEVQYG